MGGFTLVGPAYPLRGGIAQYGSSLYLALSQRHDVRFVSYRRQYPNLLFPGKTQRDPSTQPLIVPANALLDPLSPLSWGKAVRAIRNDPPDALLVMWWNPFFAPMLTYVARRVQASLRIPVVFFCHNVMPHESTMFDRLLVRMAFSAATHFVVQSMQERERLEKIRPGIPVEVVYHPCQSFFRSMAPIGRESARKLLVDKGVLPRDQHAANTDQDSGRRKILLYFGHVRHYKGVDILLKAMRLVIQREFVELMLVGEFYEDRSKYEHLIRENNLENAVHVVDQYIPNEDVSHYFEAADAVVLPYRSGTQSGVLPLAYEFERPAIVTRVGGIPEALAEGMTGLLVEPENPHALAEAILSFYRDNLGARFLPHLKPAAQKMSWGALVFRLENFLRANPIQNWNGKIL